MLSPPHEPLATASVPTIHCSPCPPGDRVGYLVRRGGAWRLCGGGRRALIRVFTRSFTHTFHSCSRSPRVSGPSWALPCRVQGSSPLLRSSQFHGETLTLKGHQTKTGPRAWPSHPWHIKDAGTLRPPPPEQSTRPPLQNPLDFTLTPHHLPLVRGGERGCSQCPLSPLPTTEPFLGGLQPWLLSRGWLYKELSPGAGTKSKNLP